MKRTLVLYFSVYGTTRSVAEEVAKKTGWDIVEIVPEWPYDSDRNHYRSLAGRARREEEQDARPGIRNLLPVAAYDRIVLGYPVWWYTMPMILRTLFEQYDFTGKEIIPFTTHMGSGDAGTGELIRHLAPGAEVRRGFSVEMQEVESGAGIQVPEWFSGMKEEDG